MITYPVPPKILLVPLRQTSQRVGLQDRRREMKIIDKIQHAVEAKEPFYSFEFFPPKTSAGVENL